MEKMEYIQIPKSVYDAMKVTEEYILTEEDVARMNIYKSLFAKVIRQKALSLQFSIGEWKVDNVPVMLETIKQLEIIAKEYESIQEVFWKQQEAEKEKEEKE